MNNLDTLFIRACKSKDPHKRVRSVYRRYYLGGTNVHSCTLSGILLEVVNKHCPISVDKLINDLAPQSMFTYGTEEYNYWDTLLKVLVSHVRFTGSDVFPDMRKTARTRNQHN